MVLATEPLLEVRPPTGVRVTVAYAEECSHQALAAALTHQPLGDGKSSDAVIGDVRALNERLKVIVISRMELVCRADDITAYRTDDACYGNFESGGINCIRNSRLIDSKLRNELLHL